MINLINLRGKCDDALGLIRNPVTEMISAFVIDMSKNYIFAFVHQFTGNNLTYLIFQYSLLILPWIILGHGALRYINSQNTGNVYSNLKNSYSTQISKKSLNLPIFVL